MALLFGSWRSRNNIWWPEALTEAGIAVLLFGPLLLIQRKIEQAFGAVRHAQERVAVRQESLAENQKMTDAEVAKLAGEVAQARADIQMTRDQLTDAVLSEIGEKRERDAALFRSVSEMPTWRAVLTALNRAQELEIIPASGCRVPLFGFGEYLRFAPDDLDFSPSDSHLEPDSIGLTIESEDGTASRHIAWSDKVSPAGISLEIAEALQAIGAYPGDSEFKAGDLFKDLGEMLTIAHRSASNGGTSYPLVNVIQFCPPQWVICDDGIVSIQPGGRYKISARRFDEEWENQMYNKSWINEQSFSDAFTAATALYKNGMLSVKPAITDPWDAISF